MWSPRKFANVFLYVIMFGGRIVSKVTGPKQLEVPCGYRIKGNKKCIENAGYILQEMLTRTEK